MDEACDMKISCDPSELHLQLLDELWLSIGQNLAVWMCEIGFRNAQSGYLCCQGMLSMDIQLVSGML